MAEIVGGIGISHIPTIGMAIDRNLTDDPAWKPVFDGYEKLQRWVGDRRPDVAIVIYNDHGSAFDLDLVPTFAIGAAEKYRPADEGFGRRGVPDFKGDVDLAWHLIDSVIPAGFDLTVVQDLDVDHGFSVPMSAIFGPGEAWPVSVVPIAVNVVQQPTPSGQRCFDLGRSIRAAIESYPADARILVVGTGGMSHQLQGQRAGHINQEFDNGFLDKLQTDPDALTRLSNADLIDLAGSEGAELVMWLVMRGALGETAVADLVDYFVPVSNTAAGMIAMTP